MMLRHLMFTALLLFARSSVEQPQIEISLGTLKGLYKLSYDNRIFAAFEGIPYGKPPLGALRFKKALPAEPWPDTWDATLIHECKQLDFVTNEPIGSEDCLYLNVYVPKEKLLPTEKLDVLVFIHGGAFMMGTPEFGGPEYLMDRNIVYVTLSYRLGALGFLSTEDDVVSGNNGLKDQNLALQWVQNHIGHFGGNPDCVTLIGTSAGGASVHFHYFSSLSKGLFHRGISQSGTALAPWAIKETPLEITKQLAASVGCHNPPTEELVECLRGIPANDIVKNSFSFSPIPGFPIAPFAPVIEKISDGFLIDYPYKLFLDGNFSDLPWITSGTTEEGILGLATLEYKWDNLNNNWNDILPYCLDYNYTVDESDKTKVANEIRRYYFDQEDVTDANVQSIIKLFGDRYFTLALEKSARMQAKVSKSLIYSYIYGYQNQLNFSSLFGKNYGVGHGDDDPLLYVAKFAGITFKVDKLSESDAAINELLLDIVTSFAKDGKPEPKVVDWESVVDDGDFRYLFIHQANDVKMVSKKEIAPTEFWHSLPIKENENMVINTNKTA